MRRGRLLRRRYYSRSNDTELDRQGRILIPAEMREKVGLNGQVVIAGGHECLEVWPADRWKEEVEDADETLPEDQEPVD
jgi:MraZ protein